MLEGINFEDIVEESLAGVYIHDENLKIVYVNKIVERATRYSKDELIGMNILQLAHGDDVAKLVEVAKRVMSGKEVFYEARFTRRDGDVRWVLGFAKPLNVNGSTYVLGNWIDITRIKVLEEKLRENEVFYRTLIKDSLAPIYIVQNSKVKYLNRAFEELTGYTKEELVGKNPFFLVHPGDRDKVYNRYLQRERGMREPEVYSWRTITKNGEVKWITAKPNRIIYNGKPAVAATLMDTTSIHQLTEKLRMREDYLRLLNKMLRHDIANALVLVKFILEDRDDELSKNALRRVEYVTRLIKEAASLESALEKLRPLRLDEVAKEIAESFSVEHDCENVVVMANDGLHTIVYNLVHNAVHHSGGNVKVEVRKMGEWGVLRVIDDGKGIPDELKERIFEEGFTTAGTGLGLFIARKMVEIYGGIIRVYDNKPKGTIFEVRLRTV